jgi:adenylate cyclase
MAGSTILSMGREIERKFLVATTPDWLERCERIEIEQGYLAIAEGSEVRLRRSGEDMTLTVKRGQGEVREEFEVELTAPQFDALWPACADARILKRRYLAPLGDDLCAEIDVYGGDLDGLTVVEVEFPDETRSKGFHPQPWFGREVTEDERYANRSLALAGMPDE